MYCRHYAILDTCYTSVYYSGRRHTHYTTNVWNCSRCTYLYIALHIFYVALHVIHHYNRRIILFSIYNCINKYVMSLWKFPVVNFVQPFHIFDTGMLHTYFTDFKTPSWTCFRAYATLGGKFIIYWQGIHTLQRGLEKVCTDICSLCLQSLVKN
jgi:hypothetical protein